MTVKYDPGSHSCSNPRCLEVRLDRGTSVCRGEADAHLVSINAELVAFKAIALKVRTINFDTSAVSEAFWE